MEKEGGLDRFSRGYQRFGFSVGGGGISFREYAPAAVSVTLIGDFSEWELRSRVECCVLILVPDDWNRDNVKYQLKREEFGRWHIFIPNNPDGSLAIPHGSKVKVSFECGKLDEIDLDG